MTNADADANERERMTAPKPPQRIAPSIGRIGFEIGWLLVAGFTAIAVTSHVAQSSGRGEMMFLDGDSMVVPMISKSIISGVPSDWAMSPTLFLPEIALYIILSLLHMDVVHLQFFSGALNLILLYVSLRLVAGCVISGRNRRPLGAILAFGAFCALILLEGSGDRNSLELASLLTLTTYYSGTVLAAVLCVGLSQKLVTSHRLARGASIALAAVSSISMLSNPLFAAWVALPLSLVVLVVAWGRAALRLGALVVAVLVGGSIAGYLARIPLDHWIVAVGDNYVQPSQASASLGYYSELLDQRMASPGGIGSVVLVVLLAAVGVVLSVASARSATSRGDIVAVYSWFAPVITTVGFIVLGTHAARYLQPWAFATILSLIVLVDRVTLPKFAVVTRPVVAVATAAACVASLVATVLMFPAASRAMAGVNSSLACAVDWITDSGRVGAGQFWSVRAVKAHLSHPQQLLQVSHRLNGYSWLVDRRDFDQHTVSFLLTDSQSSPFESQSLPTNGPSRVINCGRFQIADYYPAQIEVGPRYPG